MRLAMVWLCIFTLACARHASAHEAPEGEPAYTFRQAYDIHCSVRLFRAALEHPYLTGKLWEAYGFAPEYRFSRTADPSDGLHVDDPSGAQIRADVHPAPADPFSFTWHGRGTVRFKRGMPVDAVITMEVSSARQDSVTADISIALYTDSGAAKTVMFLGGPLISHYVDKRCDHHTKDLARMLRA